MNGAGDEAQTQVLIDEPAIRLEITPEGLFSVRLRESDTVDVQMVADKLQPHLEAHAPVRYFVDVTGIQQLELSERWRLSRRMKANRKFITATAVVGLSSSSLFMFNVIVRASGRSSVRAFSDRDEALAWLCEQ